MLNPGPSNLAPAVGVLFVRRAALALLALVLAAALLMAQQKAAGTPTVPVTVNTSKSCA